MSTERRDLPGPRWSLRRFVTRGLLGAAAVILGTFCFFLCQGLFSGYPQYHTDLLSIIGMFLIAGTGAAAWIIDHRRIDADE